MYFCIWGFALLCFLLFSMFIILFLFFHCVINLYDRFSNFYYCSILLLDICSFFISVSFTDSKNFFSLLSVTSYSSFAFHKFSVAIYNSKWCRLFFYF